MALSATIGNAIDSLLFLWIAFGSLGYFWGQFWGKSEMVAIGVALTMMRRRIAPIRAAGAYAFILSAMACSLAWRLLPALRRISRGKPRDGTCTSCGSRYFANSAPTVGALCEDARRPPDARPPRRRAAEGQVGHAGRLSNEGERPLDGLRRELLEETGLEIEPLELLGICTDIYGTARRAQSIISLNWLVRVVSGTPVAADVAEIGWFTVDELPSRASSRFRAWSKSSRCGESAGPALALAEAEHPLQRALGVRADRGLAELAVTEEHDRGDRGDVERAPAPSPRRCSP